MKRFVEPQREVMRRLGCYYRVALSSLEPKLVEAARQLAEEGYLETLPDSAQAGLTYAQYAAGPKVTDLAALRAL